MAPDDETTSEDVKVVRRRDGPPTIGDVARLAGTSEATVSRALRGSRRVGEELRRSVVQAAEALDYTPNPHAQALARSVDAAIGVVVHDTGDPYFVEILRGVLDPAERSGRMVMVCDTRRDTELEFAYVRHFRTQRVHALLLAGSGFEDRAFGAQMTSEISALERSGARVAMIGRHHILGDSVVPDNEDGAYQMARALVDLGHSRIGIISGPPSLTTTQDRLAGIRRALAESGIETDLIRSGDFTRDRGAEATDELLAADPGITAIFSLNDMMAIGALSVARSRGLRVPEDISIAGFDDIPIAADLWPALSTVRVPMVEMGVRALQLALGPHSTSVQIVRLPTELVVRQSTGPARSV